MSDKDERATDRKVEVAIEEWKHLQFIISHQDDNATRFIRWTGAGLVALSALYLRPEARPGDVPVARIELGPYIIACCALIFAMGWMSAVFRVAQDRAIGRAAKVEWFLGNPDNRPYCGPKIGESLEQWNGFCAQARSFWNVRIFAPFALYAAGVFIVVMWIGPP